MSAMQSHRTTPFRTVTSPAELRRTVDQLRNELRLAVDTESNSLYAYPERVCLVQLSIPRADFLVDTLALDSLGPLAEVLADPGVEKIFHAAEYDLIGLDRDFGIRVRNLFDTRVALRTLGRQRTGLGDVLAQEFGVKVNKRWQRANWGQRPLPENLLDYARMDSHYLLPLHARLVDELERRELLPAVREECLRLEQTRHQEHAFDENGFWRIAGTRDLTPRQQAVLRELYSFREQQARRLNRPPFKVLSNKALLAIAVESPTRAEQLERVPGLSPRLAARFGRGLLQAVQRGLRAPIPRRPRPARVPDAVMQRYTRLHSWRKQRAKERGIESDLILPREMLWEIARRRPRTADELRAIMQPLEWRFQQYGAEILELIA